MQVRDRVLLSAGVELPWRRSAEWLAVKAVVHSELVSQQGATTGTLTYKLTLLLVHQQLGELLLKRLKRKSSSSSSSSSSSTSSDSRNAADRVDLSMQVFAKVARRMYKLQSVVASARSSDAVPPQQLLQSCDTALHETAAWLCTERAALDAAWQQEAVMRPGTAVVNFTGVDFREHTNHSLPAALGHLRTAMAARQNTAAAAVAVPACTE
jgi:hypothetical protein